VGGCCVCYVMRCASDRGSFEVLERGELFGEQCRDPPLRPDMRLLARPSCGNDERGVGR